MTSFKDVGKHGVGPSRSELRRRLMAMQNFLRRAIADNRPELVNVEALDDLLEGVDQLSQAILDFAQSNRKEEPGVEFDEIAHLMGTTK